MTDSTITKKPELTLIRGGRSDASDFALLPFTDKLAILRQAPAKKRLAHIIDDPDGEQLAQALPPQELYRTFKEIGAVDALELISMASPEQRIFFLDMDLWMKDSFSQENALEWLGYLLETEEEKFVELFRNLDFELLILIFFREITVGGGVGELLPDNERTEDWDHSFDNQYFITFRNPKNSRLIGTCLDILFRRERQLYQNLLEGVKNEVESELEDEALAFRTGRLADLGFPSREEAISIYFRIDPAAFVPEAEKKQLKPGGVESTPVLTGDDSLLARLLRKLDSEELYLELNYLINNALFADDTAFDDPGAIQAIMTRVSGYLTIALEFVSGDDEEKAAGLLERESLKRLFQLGNSILMEVKKLAGACTASDYATGKALNGLKLARPLFYRGLDPDAVDGYREFRGYADVLRMKQFLEQISR